MAVVCGTGGWGGPGPGDPNNDSILNAVGTFNGIEVSWSLPTTNPHAVAHVILYRGLSSDFGLAIQRAVVDGNTFYDVITEEVPVEYFYWIELVSANSGMPGAVIGPASAFPIALVSSLIVALTGQIDNGVLATALREDIANITTQGASIVQEIQDRIAADDLLGASVQLAQDSINDAYSVLLTEIDQRTAADDALIAKTDLMIVGVNDNASLISNETSIRATDTDALAKAVGYLYAQVGLDLASAINTSAEAQAGSDGAYTELVTIGQSIAPGNIASVQTTMATDIGIIDGKVTDIGALYTVQVGTNGLVGGFGIYNDGTSVEAGFDVDTFWVGRTGITNKKPFIISGPNVYIDNAFITALTADKIDTRGLTIKDMAGNVIFGSGTGLDWGQISGAGKPADNANYTTNTNQLTDGAGLGNTAVWSNVSGTGKPADNATVGADIGTNVTRGGFGVSATDFAASWNKLTSGNITTFISGAAIGTAQIQNAAITNALIQDAAISNAKIGDASITSAKIGTAQIDTLRIAGNAVTVPVSAGGTTGITTATINPEGGNVMIIAHTRASIHNSSESALIGVLTLTLGENGVAIGTSTANYWIGAGETQSVETTLLWQRGGSYNRYYTVTASAGGSVSYYNSIIVIGAKR